MVFDVTIVIFSLTLVNKLTCIVIMDDWIFWWNMCHLLQLCYPREALFRYHTIILHLLSCGFYFTMVTFQMTLLTDTFPKYYDHGWLKYGCNPSWLLRNKLVYFAFWKSCNEILSWKIEIWMEIYLLSDNNYNIVNL